MTPEFLRAEFERMSSAPDAIPRLRRFILDLAVRGKLVSQDSSDESVRGYVGNTSTPIAGSAPWPLPKHWIWTTLGDIADFSAGRTPSRNDLSYWNTGDYPWVSIADMSSGQTVTQTKESVSEKARVQVFRSDPLPAGTMIMSFKLSIGKVAYLGVPAYHNEAIIALRLNAPDIAPYLFKVLPEQARAGATKNAIKGATLNRRSLADIRLPLPPRDERQRIVARIDQLMTVCDELESAQKAQEKMRDATATAALSSLTAVGKDGSLDSETFGKRTQFFVDHCAKLIARPEQVAGIRRAILDLAVRGLLLTSRNVDFLHPGIDAKDDDLTQTIRQSHGGVPFAIPAGWAWSTLRALVAFGPKNGLSPRETLRRDAPKCITLTATTRGVFDPRHFKYVDAVVPPDSSLWLSDGDLLFQRGNTREYVGIAALYTGPPKGFIYPDLMIKVRLKIDIDPHWVHLVALAPVSREYFAKHASGTQPTMPKINHTVLNELPIPVPPLQEQRELVAGVDKFMALCDELQAALEDVVSQRARLLQAALTEGLASGDINGLPSPTTA